MQNANEIERVLIVGAGWVGRQVAARMAQYGLQVGIRDANLATCEDALRWMGTVADDEPEHGELSNGSSDPRADIEPGWLGKVQIAGDSGSSPEAYDLVLECVPEQVSLKKRVLRQISAEFRGPTIIASNSSYFVPSMLSKFVNQPERFAHLHFHVPVLRTSVVDIVAAEQTDSNVITALEKLVERIGHQPLILNREHPGYIFNWLLQSVLKSAMQLSSQGVASPENIDKSWKAVTGMPLGPFGIMDQIGLDVIEQVLHNSKWAPPADVSTEDLLLVLRPLIRDGHLGTKTGQGFYDYGGDGNSE